MVLEFAKADGSIFAQSVVDCSVSAEVSQEQPPQRRIQHWLEGTVDSSRYFTLKIAGPDGREATIGFGFRDRDPAIDLRESMQHYETAMRREHEAAVTGAPKYTVPKLAQGERIHINTGKSNSDCVSSSSTSKPKKGKDKDSSRTGLPLLLKKPPPSPESAAKQQAQQAEGLENVRMCLDGVTSKKSFPNVDDKNGCGEQDGESDHEDDWDAEFVSAN